MSNKTRRHRFPSKRPYNDAYFFVIYVPTTEEKRNVLNDPNHYVIIRTSARTNRTSFFETLLQEMKLQSSIITLCQKENGWNCEDSTNIS
ncbi:hypothetical protein ABEB36_004065 [Hypothenemus hampei]|uniref:Uncharacterized protein n=1 Tax=Hypothenemus hampei TaxID=57062 RepID=A0ABD1F229_HYPHA